MHIASTVDILSSAYWLSKATDVVAEISCATKLGSSSALTFVCIAYGLLLCKC